MKNGFQHTSGNGPRLIGNHITVLPFPPWINVAGLHSFFDRDAVFEQPAQNPMDLSPNRIAVYLTHEIPDIYQIPNLSQRLEKSLLRNPEHPFLAITADRGWNPSVSLGLSFP